jgi:hypothetical protein
MSLGYMMNLLMDYETELYLESREDVCNILKEELVGNPYRLLEL